MSPDDLDSSFALPLSSRTIKPIPSRRHKRPRLANTAPLPLPPSYPLPSAIEGGVTDGSGSTEESGHGSPATPAQDAEGVGAVGGVAGGQAGGLPGMLSLDSPRTKAVIADLAHDLSQGIADLTLRRGQHPSPQTDALNAGSGAEADGYPSFPSFPSDLATATAAAAASARLVSGGGGSGGEVEDYYSSSTSDARGDQGGNKKKRKVPSTSAGLAFSSTGAGEHSFSSPVLPSTSVSLDSDSKPPCFPLPPLLHSSTGGDENLPPTAFRFSTPFHTAERDLADYEQEVDELDGEGEGVGMGAGGFTIGGLGPAAAGGGGTIRRGEFGSAIALAKALTSHHVKLRKRPISSPRHYGRRLQKAAFARYEASAASDRPGTPPAGSLPAIKPVNLPPTPAATPDRKAVKKGMGGKVKGLDKGAQSKLQIPQLVNLYDTSLPLHAIPGLVEAPREAQLPAGVLTPPSSDNGGDVPFTEGKKRLLGRIGPATGEPDDFFDVSEHEFTFYMPVEVLTRRLADLHLAIADEKREREKAVRQAMLIATEAQQAAREQLKAAATAPVNGVEDGAPPVGAADGGSAGKPATNAAASGQAPATGAPGKKTGGKKKKGKKKRSAHANANNVHHRDNYVPSRYPATSSANPSYLTSYHHPFHPNVPSSEDGPGIRVVTPSELITQEVEGEEEPAYRKDHVFIDPMTTFPGTDPHLHPHDATPAALPESPDEKVLCPPSHAQLGPSAVASYFADPEEWICAFCEYELWFGEEPLFLRALRQRKTVLKRRRKARERAARAASGGGGKGSTNGGNAASAASGGGSTTSSSEPVGNNGQAGGAKKTANGSTAAKTATTASESTQEAGAVPSST